MRVDESLRRVRLWIALFITGLVLSGVTAFPLVHESQWLVKLAETLHLSGLFPALTTWLQRIAEALAETQQRYPFLAYGTDWLAFAHFVIAVAFIGPYRDPVRNRWVIDMGLIACAGVLGLALIAGPIRGIPFYWRMVDCSFGVFGAIPLLIVRRQIDRMQQRQNRSNSVS